MATSFPLTPTHTVGGLLVQKTKFGSQTAYVDITNGKRVTRTGESLVELTEDEVTAWQAEQIALLDAVPGEDLVIDEPEVEEPEPQPGEEVVLPAHLAALAIGAYTSASGGICADVDGNEAQHFGGESVRLSVVDKVNGGAKRHWLLVPQTITMIVAPEDTF